jgi:hypothetical protein
MNNNKSVSQSQEQSNQSRQQSNQSQEQSNQSRQQSNQSQEQSNQSRQQSNQSQEQPNQSRQQSNQSQQQSNQTQKQQSNQSQKQQQNQSQKQQSNQSQQQSNQSKMQQSSKTQQQPNQIQQVNTISTMNSTIPPLPPPVISLNNNKNEKKEDEPKKRKQRKRKEISYDDLNITYKDENVFGKTFSKKAKHLKCAIDFLTLHQFLNKRGKIKDEEYKFIKKRYLWQYIYYIRIHNKNIDMFQKYLGLGHKIKAIQLYKMIKEEVDGNKENKNINKKELKSFINKLFRKNLNLKIPFMEYYVMKNRKKISKKKEKVETTKIKEIKEIKQINKLDSIPTKIDIEVKTNSGKVKELDNKSNINIKINAKLQKIK